MLLVTMKIQEFERFLKTFSTRGAAKRKQHGSKGTTLFRDPNDPNRLWALFEWDEEGFNRFLSDPEVPSIFQEAGLDGKPQVAPMAGRYDG